MNIRGDKNKITFEFPMGVSAWIEMGKKYGYDKYFQKTILAEQKEIGEKAERFFRLILDDYISKADIKRKIDKEIERWEKEETKQCCLSSYKISALYDLRKLIK